MSNPGTPDAPPRALGTRAKSGKRTAQAAYFVLLVWVIVAGAVEILREGLFAPKVPRNAAACQAELVTLRTRLADAALAHPEAPGELAAVRAFRASLGGEAGRDWDNRVIELLDGCPAAESAAAYELARLRAAHEAMVRIDAQEVAPARDAHTQSLKALVPVTAPIPPQKAPQP